MTQTFRFEDDADSWEHLYKNGFKETRGGMIYHPDKDYQFQAGDEKALCELLYEWDYGWCGLGHPGVYPPYNEKESTVNVPTDDDEPLGV